MLVFDVTCMLKFEKDATPMYFLGEISVMLFPDVDIVNNTIIFELFYQLVIT